MRDYPVWQLIHESLERSILVALLTVVDSEGSSPGRQGFKMAVNAKGKLAGSVGGGSMEFDLVEQTKDLLREQVFQTQLLRRLHFEDANAKECSGMICSGNQTVVICPLQNSDKRNVSYFLTRESSKSFFLSPKGIRAIDSNDVQGQYNYQYVSDDRWIYLENLSYRNKLIIFGGGHVSLALTKIMAELDFDITVYDDRDNIDTFENNQLANHKKLIYYTDAEKYVPDCFNTYVVIMTASHVADDIVLEKVIDKKVNYLGMMGSQAKVQELFARLCNRGISEQAIKKVHAPIGIAIKSQTPEEIAISIAAEIIAEKNKLNKSKKNYQLIHD